MYKKIAILLSLVMVMGLLAACGNPPVDDSSKDPSTNSSKTLVDELGRTVEIPENPERVLGLTSAVMEALFNVGITPIGKVEEYKIRDEGIALESVGMTQTLNVEKIIELEPDFIIASSRYHASIKDELELVNCPIYFFDQMLQEIFL